MGGSRDPVIVGFLCNWCAYPAADLVGMARKAYSPAMRTVRVMCSSRVDPELALKAFREGADGVLVFGCHPGECHYVEGNLKALRRMMLLRHLLEQLGVEAERVKVVWAAASEGTVLADAVDRMSDELKALGPLRWPSSVLDGIALREEAREPTKDHSP